MPYRLTFELSDSPLLVDLANGLQVIGSAEDADITIRAATVSRRHAHVRVEESEVWIEDLGSTNGTKVNDQKVTEPVRIRLGDRLTLGSAAAILSEVSSGDLQAAILLGQDSPPIPIKPRPQPHHTAGTVPGGELEMFLLDSLNNALRALAKGARRIDLAQQIGAEIVAHVPCASLQIRRGKALLFHWQSEAARAEETLVEQQADLELHLSILTPRLRDVSTRLARLVLRLLVLADDPLEQPRPAAPQKNQPIPSVDPLVRELFQQAEKVATSSISVLILGESGTGKEVLARFIHDSSDRSGREFIGLNCAALPKDLLEVELFGIEKGVATGVDARPGKFELAHEGTLFLDEIGDLAPEIQAMLLRVLQEGVVSRLGGQELRPAKPRILSATNRDLNALMESGDFRLDLFFRLGGWIARLPPLREHPADIPQLAAKFLAEASARRGSNIQGISVDALEGLLNYDWIGNVRELRHEIERAALFLPAGGLLEAHQLNPSIQALAQQPATLKERLEGYERAQISAMIQRTRGDMSKAAKALGISRSTIYRRLEVLGIAATSDE